MMRASSIAHALPAPSPVAGRNALLKLFALGALAALLLRHEWPVIFEIVLHESEAAHAAVVPLLIALLAYRRRHALAESLRHGSLWGLPLILLGVAMYVFSTWPFNYGQPRQMAIVPMLAGAILCVTGWRTLKLCVPMLILLAVAIPLGSRHFAALIIRPETITLDVAEKIFSGVPGIVAHLEGPDLHYDTGSAKGVIALGDPNRGASLLLPSLTIALFVTFIYIRPFWQVAVAAVLCGPIILLCNLARLLAHGAVTIIGDFAPISSVPRVTAHVFALALVYLSFLALFAVLNRIVIAPEHETGLKSEGESAP